MRHLVIEADSHMELARGMQSLAVRIAKALNRVWQQLVTFLLVSLAWIFFKSDSLPAALGMFRRLLAPSGWFAGEARGAAALSGTAGKVELAVALAAVGMLLLVEYLQGRARIGHLLRSLKLPLRWAIYYLFILAILFFGVFTATEFVYQGF